MRNFPEAILAIPFLFVILGLIFIHFYILYKWPFLGIINFSFSIFIIYIGWFK